MTAMRHLPGQSVQAIAIPVAHPAHPAHRSSPLAAMTATVATISHRMRLNFFAHRDSPEPSQPSAPPPQAAPPGASPAPSAPARPAKTYPADLIVWGIVIRPGFDELDDPWYHRGITQHAYVEGSDEVSLCGFRPPLTGSARTPPAAPGPAERRRPPHVRHVRPHGRDAAAARAGSRPAVPTGRGPAGRARRDGPAASARQCRTSLSHDGSHARSGRARCSWGTGSPGGRGRPTGSRRHVTVGATVRRRQRACCSGGLTARQPRQRPARPGCAHGRHAGLTPATHHHLARRTATTHHTTGSRPARGRVGRLFCCPDAGGQPAMPGVRRTA